MWMLSFEERSGVSQGGARLCGGSGRGSPRKAQSRGRPSRVSMVVSLGGEKQVESGPGPAGHTDLLTREASGGSRAPRRGGIRLALWTLAWADMRPDRPDMRTELGQRKGSGGGAGLRDPRACSQHIPQNGLPSLYHTRTPLAKLGAGAWRGRE